jgi:hypothetical protein
MRKSERIRALEVEQSALKAQLDLLTETLLTLIDIRSLEKTTLESGKWYTKPKE